MDKNQTNNKIGESFENQLPNEQLPEFIWDNISEALDINATPIESTEKIKTSFEEGFEKEALPTFIWGDIQGELDATSTLDADLTATNRIKTSFEGKYQEDLPSNLWNNVEEQLEIETVWQRVHQALNRRTRKRYWQEKGMQLGIVAMAIFWLRGCGIGDGLITEPIAIQASQPKTEFAQPKTEHTNSPSTSTILLENNKIEASTENEATGNVINNAVNPVAFNANVQASSSKSNSGLKASNVVANPTSGSLVVNKSNRPSNSLPLAVIGKKEEGGAKENSTTEETPDIIKTNPSTLVEGNNKPTSISVDKNVFTVAQSEEKGRENANIEGAPLKAGVNTLSNSTIKNVLSTVVEPIDLNNNKSDLVITEELMLKQLFKDDMLPIIVGQEIPNTEIYPVDEFEIESVVNKKRHALRFELGMDAKMGTSLLLGTATSRAMETTSMLKTKMRLAGSVGVLLNVYLTANDAIVFGAYPFANNQQYFGGYTREGRYYHKEIKLAYFDLTLGYQRTLFHYNDFGTIPSSMYARVDYGFGYLSKGEETINGVAVELGDSYNKINHNLGLTIGSTHRIKRFVIDYGVYANMGISSVLNQSPSGATTMEYSHLMNMGGHIGLRYVL